jgi:hypothetical protein
MTSILPDGFPDSNKGRRRSFPATADAASFRCRKSHRCFSTGVGRAIYFLENINWEFRSMLSVSNNYLNRGFFADDDRVTLSLVTQGWRLPSINFEGRLLT